MMEEAAQTGWRSLLRPEWLPILAVLLGGIILQSMSVLLLVTVLPSVVGELGGVEMLSWPTTAYLASSIVAASCAGVLAGIVNARTIYCGGVAAFGLGAILCSLAPSMDWIVTGRLLQGFGGGLEASVAYVIVRRTFPESIWPRAIALMAGGWSLSVLIGPLIGGTFAGLGSWRNSFVATAIIAAVLTVSAFFVVPPVVVQRRGATTRMPMARVGLICLAIAALSAASVLTPVFAKIGLVLAALASLAAMLRIDRAAETRMLPRDAFSLSTPAGVGLWLALLVCITYSPLQIYVPVFLQHLHGLDPLAAGFVVASASLGWTVASLVTAGAVAPWPDRLMLSGPLIMGGGLLAIGVLTPHVATWPLIPAIVVLGVGIGQSWPFVAHHIMSSAQPGDETIAASSIPMIQQLGFALGASFAGLVASSSGLTGGTADGDMRQAAFGIPASFVVPAGLACAACMRLRWLQQP
jgi:predicted MFS family arabinose efflux permease